MFLSTLFTSETATHILSEHGQTANVGPINDKNSNATDRQRMLDQSMTRTVMPTDIPRLVDQSMTRTVMPMDRQKCWTNQ